MMKNYFDQFYEVLHKNSIKRRRMISLLLVLSMFVSSSVVWGLRGTVVTMVNEPDEVLEEMPDADETEAEKLVYHVHTDDCYEDVLICELEENEEHTHTEECYEKQLVCGFEDEKEADASAEAEVIGEDAELIYEPEDESEDEESIPMDDSLLPGLMLANPTALEGESLSVIESETATPGEIDTVDNIAYGIKFTLFDYGDAALEAQNNNYDLSNNGTHDNVKTSGINSGRNINDDIMFFAYGTPPPQGEATGEYLKNSEGKYIDNDGNVLADQNDSSKRVPLYKPGTSDKNNYSGDYRSVSYKSGNRPVQGIVGNDLYSYDSTTQSYIIDKNGYPRMNNTTANSLDYLFDDSTSDYKKVYTDVNHLLKLNDAHHLTFNSDDNYAYYNQDTHNFTVYDNTYHIINKDHHEIGDVNNLIKENDGSFRKYTDYKPQFKIGFFPFDQYDWTRRDPNFNGNGFNHHFGMKMEAKFNNPVVNSTDPNDAITFKYSGDDDMWVFVDGKLVLDVGGIHEPAGGMIDFTNGLVWVQDNNEGQTIADLEASETWGATLSNLKSKYTNQNYPKPRGVNTDGLTDSKWIIRSITDYLGGNWNTPDEHGKLPVHEIKMFYLERGGCYSNLAMEMNLPTLKPLSVVKNVDYKQHLVKGLYEDLEYEYQVYEYYDNKWVPCSDDPDSPVYLKDNHFFLKAGARKDFEDLDQSRKFKVVEKNYNPNIFSGVTVNGVNAVEDLDGGMSDGEGALLKDKNTYAFVNTVAEETIEKTFVKKTWYPKLLDNSPYKDYTIKFKIIRIDSVTGEEKQVALKTEIDTDEGKKTVKVRTFAIPASKWNEGYEINGLLSRYGNHYYTYRVEELNTPKGYMASYTKDGNDYLITNKSTAKVDIHVEKDWDNITAEGKKIQLKLKRKKVEFTESEPTDLTINILDEAGNLITSKTFSKTDQNKVYAGGDAEITYELPKGSELYDVNGNTEYPAQYPKKSPATENNPYVDFDDGILVLRNLAAGSNTVSFKVTTGYAEDELLLLHHSFTKDPNGWEVQGDGSAEIITSATYSYAKHDALLVKNRTNSWNGAKLRLDPAKFLAGQKYTFSAYVWSPCDADVIMTFNDGLSKPSNGSFHRVSLTHVAANTWTPITGTVSFPTDINPYGMYLLIEANNIQIFNYETASAKSGWNPLGSATLRDKSYQDNKAIIVENRSSDSDGAYYQLSSNDVTPNTTYIFESQVSGNKENDYGAGNHTIKCVAKYTVNGVAGEENIGSVNSIGNGWETIKGSFKLPADVDKNSVRIVMTEDGAGADHSFEIWSYKLEKVIDQIRIDEFTAVEGTTPVEVVAGSGQVKVGEQVSTEPQTITQTNTIYDFQFKNGKEGWEIQDLGNNHNVQIIQGNNYEGIAVTGRDVHNDGISIKVPKLEPGKKYRFKGKVQENDTGSAKKIHLSLNTGEGHYPTIGEDITLDTKNNDNFEEHFFNFNYTIPTNANRDNMMIYFETPANSNDTGSFRVNYLTITEETTETIPGTTLENKKGYDESTGQYVSDGSNYELVLNDASVTNPLKLTSNVYEDDEDFNNQSQVITLPDDSLGGNQWKFHWQSYDVSSDDKRFIASQDNDHCLYQYYVEEVLIDENGDEHLIVKHGEGADAYYMSNDGNYLVTYSGQDVATNNDQTPIKITNKYIWYTLPATGGIGADKIALLGLALTIIGILSGCSVYSRRRRPE